MTKQSQVKGSNMFTVADIDTIRLQIISQTSNSGAGITAVGADKLLTKKCYDLGVLIEILRTECYLLLKGPKLYQLQTC